MEMTDKIKIDIVSDVVCPWCTVGYKRLEKAIDDLGVANRVKIAWKPFELNPGMSDQGEFVYDYRARKYGATREETDKQMAHLSRLGAKEGFTFNFFDGMKIINSQAAHILLEYVKKFDLQTELNSRLVAAFHSEQKNISDRDVLYEELSSVGLNADEAIKILDSAEARKHIQEEEKYWIDKGIRGVPTMFFNSPEAIVGALSTDIYKKILVEKLEL